MMKNKVTKAIANGVILAAMAAVGITVYQIGTSSVNEKNEEISEYSQEKELASNEEAEQISQEDEGRDMVDAGTSNVEASMEEHQDAAILGEEDTSETVEEDSSVSEEAEETTEETQTAALALPVVDFSEDTLMEWPVNGNILIDYSMDQTTYFPTLDQYRLSPAIAVQAVESAPVVAAVNGTVFSIEEDVKTGNTLTMELGNGYQAIYGQLKDITVSEGETVTKGTIIGYISEPTKYYDVEGSNLYFAMKKDGEPIDPIAYLP